MKKIVYTLKIKSKTPLHISSGIEEGGYIDSYLVKDIEGKAYIPASSIKGKVRDNFYMLLNTYFDEDKATQITNMLFGSEGYNPSKVLFEDFKSNSDLKPTIRFGNAIDRYTKRSKDGALMNIETVEGGEFKGKVTAYIPDDAVEYEKYLNMAIKMVESIGADKSRGLGRVEISLDKKEAKI